MILPQQIVFIFQMEFLRIIREFITVKPDISPMSPAARIFFDPVPIEQQFIREAEPEPVLDFLHTGIPVQFGTQVFDGGQFPLRIFTEGVV